MHRALLAAALVAVVVAGSGAAADADASVVARYPAENGTMTETTVVSADDVASAEPTTTRNGGAGVAVTLTDAGAQSFTDALVDAGFTTEGAARSCSTDGAERNDEGYCLLTVLDGEVVYAAGLTEPLAETIESGEFAEDPRLLLATATEADANRLARAFGADVPTTTEAANATTERPATESTSPVPGFGVPTAVLAAALAAGAGLARR
ncbi:hypothetical protein [Halobacterium sp. CBA1126]|uniref:hypothetical protein n=1 Tax=Halobacterium sp. CBA1126 TaxID=2668074 RepID=UPI0012F8C0E0|nr:hypothetical protein [Halobacterium sp. CBA1126]MUV60419.1 hypothetical protein [Halobacterium sp. CBA1126]